MLQVDDTLFTDEDYRFLEQWAESLNVNVAELSGRILAAAIEGDPYVAKRPKVEIAPRPEHRGKGATGAELM